jgi:hypothetical protein
MRSRGPSHHVRRLLIACVVLAGCGTDGDREKPPPRAEALWPAPERYEVDARWAANELTGTMKLTLRNTGPEALPEVWLRTWANAFGSCAEPLATLKPSVEKRERCTAQRVAIDPPLPRGERTTLEVEFATKVPPKLDRFGRDRRVAYLGNALPTLAVHDADGWRLPPYFDQGEAWFTLAADWRVKLDVLPDLTVATTGTETEPGHYVAKNARDFMIAIGDMRTKEITVGDITVRHFRFERQPESDADDALSAARAALEAYQRWYGPYGREELDVVQGPAHVATRGIAMEYPELILTPPAGAAVAHEIAHQWWAFQMGNDPYREPFLDEGFAEFSTARLPRSVTGGNRLRGCPAPKKPPQPPLSADVPAIQKAGGRANVRTAYIGTACMLRRLQKAMGDVRFDTMLRDLVARLRDRTWTRADLIDAIEKNAPDDFDVEDFLDREGVER